MNIICGFIEQTSGKIFICNKDTQNEIDSLRKLIGYCPQRIFQKNLKEKRVDVCLFR